MTSQNSAWSSKERGKEAREIHTKEQAQPTVIGAQQEGTGNMPPSAERDFEGGFGGQEDLEDRYATTCGEH